MNRVFHITVILLAISGCTTSSPKMPAFDKFTQRNIENNSISNWELFLANFAGLPIDSLGIKRSDLLHNLKSNGFSEIQEKNDEILVRGKRSTKYRSTKVDATIDANIQAVNDAVNEAANDEVSDATIVDENPSLFSYQFNQDILISGPNLVDERRAINSWISDASTNCKIYNPYPSENEEVSWNGDCTNGIASGFGLLRWFENGIENFTYHGNLVNGRREGFGETKNKSGEIYSGYFRNDYREGKGKLIEASGAIFEGNWKNDKTCGFGRWTWSDGSYYEGTWVQPGVWKGELKIKTSEGFLFTGTLKNNKPWNGIYVDPNGMVSVIKKGKLDIIPKIN